MVKIYTKTGDRGQTSLFSGDRVSKSSSLVNAYGTVDELNSILGVVRALHKKPDHLAEMLYQLQNELFELGADLASGLAIPQRITDKQVHRLEEWIDDLSSNLPELKGFILPGGHIVAAHLHQARTVCRRAERQAVAAMGAGKLDYVLIRYINRLADLLFTMARWANRSYNGGEDHWEGGGKKQAAE